MRRLLRRLTTGTWANGTSAMASIWPESSALTLAASDGEVDDPHLVEVRLAGDPVVLVLHMHALASGREALDLERPGTDVLQRPLADRVRLVALRDDSLEVLRERLHERHVGAGEREPDVRLSSFLIRFRSIAPKAALPNSFSFGFFVRWIE